MGIRYDDILKELTPMELIMDRCHHGRHVLVECPKCNIKELNEEDRQAEIERLVKEQETDDQK